MLHNAEDKVTNINTRSALFWGITQRIVVIPNRRFWSTCRSHPQKMGLTGWPETSVMNYHYTMHNIPEESRSHLLRGRSL